MKNPIRSLKQSISHTLQNYEMEKYLKNNIHGYFPSYALSLDDESYQPNNRLYNLAYNSIQKAHSLDLTELLSRFDSETAKYINIFPGEHYRLLASIIQVLEPHLIIEIGTYTGASALVMKKFLAKNAKIITYDIFPWDSFINTGLIKSDFNEQLEQKIMDLSKLEHFIEESPIIKNADLIFIDAAKDGKMEKNLCDFLDKTDFFHPPIVIFDDIKFISMIKIWREIRHPKLDITSFGHWSGTGIIDWS